MAAIPLATQVARLVNSCYPHAMPSTWEEYFDSGGSYLAQHPDYFTPERTKREITFLLRQVIPSKEAAILDLACGQGRHTLELTKIGYRVLGVDRSAHLLNLAYKVIDREAIKIDLVKQDMRRLNLGQKFDLILLLFCPFGIESDEENKNILALIAAHLKEGGRLFFELHNLFRFVRRFPGAVTDSAWLDIQTLTLWDKTALGLELPLRLYTIPELTERLISAGLQVTKLWGDFDGSAYDLDSPRLLLLATKAT